MSDELKVTEFERVARLMCAKELAAVREAFRPSDGIEALVLVGFARGAAWALDVDADAIWTKRKETSGV